MSFLVTGANKGIGFQIVKALLKHPSTTTVFLGSRDLGRGEKARENLGPELAERCVVVQLDVSDKASIGKAAEAVKQQLESSDGAKLQGLINNAGVVGDGFGWHGVKNSDFVINTNVYGPLHTTNAFLPLLEPEGGRVVMVSSGSAPMFVEKCSEAVQAKFIDEDVTLEQVAELLTAYRKAGEANAEGSDDPKLEAAVSKAFKDAGFAESTYGISKAALNCVTMFIAKKYPKLKVNSCSPGFIATDLVKPLAEQRGVTAEQMGALPVEKGTVSPVFLAVDDVPTPPGKGYYYGSDAKRSPMHKYRSPGSPAYAGE